MSNEYRSLLNSVFLNIVVSVFFFTAHPWFLSSGHCMILSILFHYFYQFFSSKILVFFLSKIFFNKFSTERRIELFFSFSMSQHVEFFSYIAIFSHNFTRKFNYFSQDGCFVYSWINLIVVKNASFVINCEILFCNFVFFYAFFFRTSWKLLLYFNVWLFFPVDFSTLSPRRILAPENPFERPLFHSCLTKRPLIEKKMKKKMSFLHYPRCPPYRFCEILALMCLGPKVCPRRQWWNVLSRGWERSPPVGDEASENMEVLCTVTIENVGSVLKIAAVSSSSNKN